MIIILEGVDCAGKSQFARRLVDRLKHAYPDDLVQLLHRGPPVRHPIDEYARPFFDYRPDRRRHVICDRWHVGESVYPNIVDRPSHLDDAVHAWLELFLVSRGAVLVYVRTTDVANLVDCARSRDDDLNGHEVTVRATIDAFDREFSRTLLPTVTLDADGGVTDYDVATVVGAASDAALRASSTRNAVTYVGTSSPTLLLFGDRRGVSGVPSDYGDWPAFAPYVGTSGYFLMSVLTREPLRVARHGVLLSGIGLANANDVDDPRGLWNDVGRPPVVALGVDAARKLRDVHVPARRVPHPSYWKRFRHHEPGEYFQRLFGLDDSDREVAGV